MGEVELSSDELEMRVESETEKEEVGEHEGKTDSCGIEKKKKKKKKSKGESPSRIIRWERFLPKMMLRVLLVEADDSTRQIIAALLRKCSYRGPNMFNFLDFAALFVQLLGFGGFWLLL